ncbi:MAG: DegV family protein [Clostridia bacterium]|nr:DegV family protein [Clostridia bacterium]
MSIYIFSEITNDYPIKEEKDFVNLPMSVMLSNDEYDNVNSFISPSEFYKRMQDGELSNTSMVNSEIAQNAFEEKLKEGHDILYIAFSSALSGTCDNCGRILSELGKKYPERKVATVSSLNASAGEGLIVWYALRKRDEGASFEELVEYTEDIALKTISLFTVNDLKHLARLGRCSKASALIGTALSIKPIMHVDELGKLVPFDKVLSRKKALRALVDYMEDKMLDSSRQKAVFIGHGECLEDAEFVKAEIQERFGIQNVVIDYIGPVIGAHTNKGVLAIFFLGHEK